MAIFNHFLSTIDRTSLHIGFKRVGLSCSSMDHYQGELYHLLVVSDVLFLVPIAWIRQNSHECHDDEIFGGRTIKI